MNMKFGSDVEKTNPQGLPGPDFWLFALGPWKEVKNPLSKLQKGFEFGTAKAGWQVYSGFRTKVVRGNRVSSLFQKSSGHNSSGKYFLGTRIQLRNFQTKRARWNSFIRKESKVSNSHFLFFISCFPWLFLWACSVVTTFTICSSICLDDRTFGLIELKWQLSLLLIITFVFCSCLLGWLK